MVEVTSESLNLQPQDFLEQFGLYVLIGALAFFLFYLIRQYRPFVYFPKLLRKHKEVDEGEEESLTDSGSPFMIQRIHWFQRVLFSDIKKDLLPNLGLDAGILLLFVKACRDFLLWYGMPMIFILVPANAFSNLERLDKSYFYMRWLSLQYKREWTIWLNTLFCWAFSMALYVFIRSFSLQVIRLRQSYFSSPTYGLAVSHRSIMLTDIPTSLREYGKLQAYLVQCLLDPKSYHLSFIGDLVPLRRYFEKHRRALLEAESILDKMYKFPEAMKEKNLRRLAALEQKVSQFHEAILQEQSAYKDTTSSVSSSMAFLTFPSVLQASIALETLHENTFYTTMKDALLFQAPKAQEAPEPKEVLWPHASIGDASRRIRSVLSKIFTYLLTFVIFGLLYIWVIRLDLSKLFSNSSHSWLKDQSFFVSFIKTQVAPVIIVLFYKLFPSITRFLALFRGVPDKRQRDRIILSALFLFFLRSGFTFFLIDVGFDPVNAIIPLNEHRDKDDPSPIVPSSPVLDRLSDPYFLGSIPIILANSLINSSLFWISYMNVSGVGEIVGLLDPIALFLSYQPRRLKEWLHRRRTPREVLEQAKGDGLVYLPLAHTYASILFLFTLALLFSILTPMILVCAVITFTFILFVLKYRAMYVAYTKHETLGQLWPLVAHRSLVGITLGQIAVMGAINIRQVHIIPTLFLLPLPLCTLAFAFIYRTTIKPQFRYVQEGWSDKGSKKNTDDGSSISLEEDLKIKIKNVDTRFLGLEGQKDHYTPPLLLDQPPVLLISREMESMVLNYWSGPYELVDLPLHS
ncbi:MAG: hypothetical protein DHS80DRAFT_33447 [Piptocephalis tieghemiana]|nr:MAG: hypothetical protein DHS80DRAFT_33447 [Piptocephalis tieghemiana]